MPHSDSRDVLHAHRPRIETPCGEAFGSVLCLATVANRMPNCRNPAGESRIRDVATAPHSGDEVVFY